MSNWCKGQTWCERVMSLFIIGGQYAWSVVPWCMIVCLWPVQCQHWKNSSIWHSHFAPVKGLPTAQLLKWKERHSGVLSRLVVQLQFNKLVARELPSENQNSREEASLFMGSYVCILLLTTADISFPIKKKRQVGLLSTERLLGCCRDGKFFRGTARALDQIICFLFSFASRNTLGEKRFHTPGEEDTTYALQHTCVPSCSFST